MSEASVLETGDGARTVFAAGFNEILVSTNPAIWENSDSYYLLNAFRYKCLNLLLL